MSITKKRLRGYRGSSRLIVTVTIAGLGQLCGPDLIPMRDTTRELSASDFGMRDTPRELKFGGAKRRRKKMTLQAMYSTGI